MNSMAFNICLNFDRQSWILLGVFIFTISTCSGQSRCLSHQHNLDDRRCCRRCAPGSGAWSHCSYANDTKCKPCSHGETFSGLHSHVETCRQCSKLPENAHFKRKCNVTHDAIWKCNGDFYRDNDKCFPCSKCLPGWGASRRCSYKYNTICRKCPNGTFSDLLSGTSGCRVCTKCNRNQQMVQPCSSMLDTTCIDKPKGNHKTTIVRRPINKKSEVSVTPDTDLILLYCAVPTFIIVALVIYVVLLRRRRKALRNQHIKTDVFRTVPANIVYVDRDGQTVMLTTKLRDLPPGKQKEIEKVLHKKVAGRPSWTSLARELGYNKERITIMEAKAKHDSISTSRCLLREWAKSQNATVGVLIRALKNIGRIDIVKILHGQPTMILKEKIRLKNENQNGCVGPVNV